VIGRDYVFKTIDEERAYQELLPQHSRERDAKTSIGDWLIYMEEHIKRAKKAVYNLQSYQAMCHIRKVGALAVACMEYQPMVTRSEEEEAKMKGGFYE